MASRNHSDAAAEDFKAATGITAHENPQAFASYYAARMLDVAFQSNADGMDAIRSSIDAVCAELKKITREAEKIATKV